MKTKLKKSAEKYLLKLPKRQYDKLMSALAGLENLEGDIVRLHGKKDTYRLKTPPYRILFEYSPGKEQHYEQNRFYGKVGGAPHNGA
jgi:mRNA-degrading endonuclease RelE of RelBE toxin-antitoxin system